MIACGSRRTAALIVSLAISLTSNVPARGDGPRKLSIKLLAGVLEIDAVPEAAAAVPLEAALVAVETAVRELDEILAIEEKSATPGPSSSAIVGGGLRAFRAVGAPTVPPDARLVQAIERALGVCTWSGGAHGPFGGEVNSLWGLGRPSNGIPGDATLAAAVAGNRCDLRLDVRKPDLGLGLLRARLDLHGFRDGALVDRAIGALSEQGIRHARVRLAGIIRASGDAPALPKGSGWPVLLPMMPGSSMSESVFLRNRALAIVTTFEDPLVLGGESFPRIFDLRNGRPATGTLAVLVSTETASDAESVAMVLFSLGPREGPFRLGGLTPQPAARWVQGTGGGEPLVVDSRWSSVFGTAAARRN